MNTNDRFKSLVEHKFPNYSIVDKARIRHIIEVTVQEFYQLGRKHGYENGLIDGRMKVIEQIQKATSE